MTQALFKPITVEEFLEWVPENSDKRYELHNEAIVDLMLLYNYEDKLECKCQEKRIGLEHQNLKLKSMYF